MAYADITFYKTKYCGRTVPEADFAFLSEQASDRIDEMTGGRLADLSWLDEYQLGKVKKACCAMTESLYYYETLRKSGMEKTGSAPDGKGKIISSITSGSESVSYATGGISASSLEGMAIQKMADDGERLAAWYLSGILYKDKGYSILFRGIGYE